MNSHPPRSKRKRRLDVDRHLITIVIHVPSGFGLMLPVSRNKAVRGNDLAVSVGFY